MLPTRADRLQTAAWLGLGLALLGLIYLLAPILTPFVIAAVLAYICDPGVNALVKRRVPRPLAVLVAVLGLGLGVALLALILIPMIYREALTLATRLPDLLELANQRLIPLLEQRFGLHVRLDANSVRKWVENNWSTAQDLLPMALAHLKIGGIAVIGVVANIFLIPIVMFYLLQEWPRIIAAIRGVIPRPMLERTMSLLHEVDGVLSEFLRGQISVMLLLAVYYSLGLWITGLNFALPVGVITGLLVFIPYIGFSTGLLLAVLAAILQGDGWGLLIGVGVVFAIGQFVESFLLTPYLVGERIGLHPLAVIFALMAFGQLFGFVGVLLALPASAVLLVALRRLHALYLQSRLYRGNEEGQA